MTQTSHRLDPRTLLCLPAVALRRASRRVYEAVIPSPLKIERTPELLPGVGYFRPRIEVVSAVMVRSIFESFCLTLAERTLDNFHSR